MAADKCSDWGQFYSANTIFSWVSSLDGGNDLLAIIDNDKDLWSGSTATKTSRSKTISLYFGGRLDRRGRDSIIDERSLY